MSSLLAISTILALNLAMASLGVPTGAKNRKPDRHVGASDVKFVQGWHRGKVRVPHAAIEVAQDQFADLGIGKDTGSFIICTSPGSTSLSESAPPR